MPLVTYTHTTTAPASDLVRLTLGIILRRTTNISQEDIDRLMRGLDNNWIQQIRIYAVDDQMRWHAQLVLEIDRSERQSQLSLLKAAVALDEERPSGNATAIELDQTVNLFLEYLRAYSLGTIWHVVYTQKVYDDPNLYATVQRALGYVRAEPVMWAEQKREADLPFRSELPELLVSSSWPADMPSSDEGELFRGVHRELQTILRIRLTQEPLTAQNLNTIISALTELSTKYWLIAKGRFADLIEYTQTHNGRFAEDANIVVARITYNSPMNMDWKVDLSAPSVAEALVTTIDGITQTSKRLKQKELENQAKAQEIQHAEQQAAHEEQMSALEQAQRRLEIEKQHLEVLEKQLEVQKKGIEYALEIAGKVVDTLHSGADPATRAMEIQALLPNLLQLQNGKGLELALPVSQEKQTPPKQS